MKLKELLFERKGEFDNLKKNKVKLTDDEHKLVMKSKAVWHHGKNGEATSAVWKSENGGKTTFITNTHRAWQKSDTLKGCIGQYHDFIKSTA